MTSTSPVTVRVPGSKSHAIRAVILGALARGRSRVRGAPGSEDMVNVVRALRDLGVAIRGEPGESDLEITGTAGRLDPGKRHLKLGGSGTGIRFLAAVAALRRGETILEGDRSLQRRTMESTVESLRRLNVVVQSARGCAPLFVKHGPASAPDGPVEVDVSISSQPASALLVAGSVLAGGLRVRLVGEAVSMPYLDLTVDVLRGTGVEVRRRGNLLTVRGGPPGSRDHEVEADWSSAAFALAAGVLGDRPVRVPGLSGSSRQADRAVVSLLRAAGGAVRCTSDGATARRKGALRPFTIDLRHAPDLAPVAAVLATFAEGESRVTGAAHLRHKESDRIAACVEGVRVLGARAEATGDGFVVRGGTPGRGTVDTRGDHRIALAFHVAGIVRSGVEVNDLGCVAKSWPDAVEALSVLR